MVAAVQGTVIPAGKWGKAKTASQMLAIAALIIEPRWIKPEWTLWGQRITWYLVLIMLVLTVVSGVDYFVHARQRIQVHADEASAAQEAASGEEEPVGPANAGDER